MFKPGNPGNLGGTRAPGAGRKPGIPNKATTRTREAITALVEANLDNLTVWLKELHESDGPGPCLKIVVDLLEFTTPKLNRTELTGLDGGAVNIVATKNDETI
jgi:hypothetical protein